MWRRLRLTQGEAAGREALAALRAFLAPLNAAASASLAEAGDQVITLHRLNVPASVLATLRPRAEPPEVPGESGEGFFGSPLSSGMGSADFPPSAWQSCSARPPIRPVS